MELFIDGEACRLFDNTMNWWYEKNPNKPTWDSITEELRETYRDQVRRRTYEHKDLPWNK